MCKIKHTPTIFARSGPQSVLVSYSDLPIEWKLGCESETLRDDFLTEFPSRLEILWKTQGNHLPAAHTPSSCCVCRDM